MNMFPHFKKFSFMEETNKSITSYNTINQNKMKTPEEILNEIANKHSYETWGDLMNSLLLAKERETTEHYKGLWQQGIEIIDAFNQQNDGLQTLVDDKEKEIKELRKTIKQLKEHIEELDKNC